MVLLVFFQSMYSYFPGLCTTLMSRGNTHKTLHCQGGTTVIFISVLLESWLMYIALLFFSQNKVYLHAENSIELKLVSAHTTPNK